MKKSILLLAILMMLAFTLEAKRPKRHTTKSGNKSMNLHRGTAVHKNVGRSMRCEDLDKFRHRDRYTTKKSRKQRRAEGRF